MRPVDLLIYGPRKPWKHWGFTPNIFFGLPFWYARLDSNQRPLESELSGRQTGKPCGARDWLRLHKFPAFWRKTLEAMRCKASEVSRGSSQIVVCALRRSRGSVHLCDLNPIAWLLNWFAHLEEYVQKILLSETNTASNPFEFIKGSSTKLIYKTTPLFFCK